jgi:putative copper export protein
MWTFLRFLHIVALVFFVGGQLMLVVAVTPAVRPHEAAMRGVAIRFAVGSAVALAVLIATGIAMASHFALWDNPTLHAKLGLFVLIFVLVGLHAVSPKSRALSYGTLAVSLGVIWLGVKLTYG